MARQPFFTSLEELEQLKSDASKSREQKRHLLILKHFGTSAPGEPLPRGQDDQYTVLFNYKLLDILSWLGCSDDKSAPIPPQKQRTTVPVLPNFVSAFFISVMQEQRITVLLLQDRNFILADWPKLIKDAYRDLKGGRGGSQSAATEVEGATATVGHKACFRVLAAQAKKRNVSRRSYNFAACCLHLSILMEVSHIQPWLMVSYVS
jgi:hypothetical protein